MKKIIRLISDSWPILVIFAVIVIIVIVFLGISGALNNPKITAFMDKPLSEIKCGEAILILVILGWLFSRNDKS